MQIEGEMMDDMHEDETAGVVEDSDATTDFRNDKTADKLKEVAPAVINADEVGGKPVLGYWDIRGLAQPIRFLLAYLSVDYFDMHIDSQEQWLRTKDTLKLPFPNLPFFIDEQNGVYLTETLAIMKYIAAKYQPEILGQTVDDKAKVEMYAHVLLNFNKIATKPCYLEGTSKQEVGDNCLKEVQTFVKHFEA